MNLDEVVDPAPHFVTHRAIRRDRGGDRCHAVARAHGGPPSDPAEVFVAVGLRKAEALRQMLANLVTVEEFDLSPPGPQFVDHKGGDRALSRAGQAGEPQTAAGRLHRGGEYGKSHAFVDVGPESRPLRMGY